MKPTPGILVAACLMVFAVWFFSVFFLHMWFNTWDVSGQVGDSFGAVNALFSGLAFAGLIYTIVLQTYELALQRDELRLQREEMAKSREQLTEQARVQRANLKVTLTQLKIISLQSTIAAIEMDSLQNKEEGRGRFVNEIKNTVTKMEKEIEELEHDVLKELEDAYVKAGGV